MRQWLHSPFHSTVPFRRSWRPCPGAPRHRHLSRNVANGRVRRVALFELRTIVRVALLLSSAFSDANRSSIRNGTPPDASCGAAASSTALYHCSRAVPHSTPNPEPCRSAPSPRFSPSLGVSAVQIPLLSLSRPFLAALGDRSSSTVGASGGAGGASWGAGGASWGAGGASRGPGGASWGAGGASWGAGGASRGPGGASRGAGDASWGAGDASWGAGDGSRGAGAASWGASGAIRGLGGAVSGGLGAGNPCGGGAAV